MVVAFGVICSRDSALEEIESPERGKGTEGDFRPAALESRLLSAP